MPDPQTLADYGRAMPGSPERIMRAFESVTVDASARDDRLADAEISIRKSTAGWLLFVAVILVIAGIVCVLAGNNAGAAICIGAPVLTAVVGVATAPFRNRDD